MRFVVSAALFARHRHVRSFLQSYLFSYISGRLNHKMAHRFEPKRFNGIDISLAYGTCIDFY